MLEQRPIVNLNQNKDLVICYHNSR